MELHRQVEAPDGTQWATYAQAAEDLQVPKATLMVWAHRGKLVTCRVGRRTWVDMTSARHAEAQAWSARATAAQHAVSPGVTPDGGQPNHTGVISVSVEEVYPKSNPLPEHRSGVSWYQPPLWGD